MTRTELLPGDCLLYAPNSFWSYAIAIKTWNKVSHVETYIGDGFSVASRDGIGVGRYPLRTDTLSYVMRPRSFDLARALAWFATVDGQRYDWIGLSRFVLWGATPTTGKNDRMFCSEFTTRFYRAGGLDPFNDRCDADAVAPAQFLYLPYPWECYDVEPEA